MQCLNACDRLKNELFGERNKMNFVNTIVMPLLLGWTFATSLQSEQKIKVLEKRVAALYCKAGTGAVTKNYPSLTCQPTTNKL